MERIQRTHDCRVVGLQTHAANLVAHMDGDWKVNFHSVLTSIWMPVVRNTSPGVLGSALNKRNFGTRKIISSPPFFSLFCIVAAHLRSMPVRVIVPMPGVSLTACNVSHQRIRLSRGPGSPKSTPCILNTTSGRRSPSSSPHSTRNTSPNGHCERPPKTRLKPHKTIWPSRSLVFKSLRNM